MARSMSSESSSWSSMSTLLLSVQVLVHLRVCRRAGETCRVLSRRARSERSAFGRRRSPQASSPQENALKRRSVAMAFSTCYTMTSPNIPHIPRIPDIPSLHPSDLRIPCIPCIPDIPDIPDNIPDIPTASPSSPAGDIRPASPPEEAFVLCVC